MYIMSNFQHPGDWEKGLHDKVKAELSPLIEQSYRNRRSAAVGYIHGLPPTSLRLEKIGPEVAALRDLRALFFRHSRKSGNPRPPTRLSPWIPAFAEMTTKGIFQGVGSSPRAARISRHPLDPSGA